MQVRGGFIRGATRPQGAYSPAQRFAYRRISDTGKYDRRLGEFSSSISHRPYARDFASPLRVTNFAVRAPEKTVCSGFKGFGKIVVCIEHFFLVTRGGDAGNAICFPGQGHLHVFLNNKTYVEGILGNSL